MYFPNVRPFFVLLWRRFTFQFWFVSKGCLSSLTKVRSVGKRAQATSSRRRKSERKITRMVVVVVAVFVFCWLPFYILNIANLLVVLPGDFRGLYFFVVVLSYANSCANPILYGFLSDNFKRGFRKALCRTSRRVKSNDRPGTEAQRPTDEWAAAVYQAQKSDAVNKVNGEKCGGTEEEFNDTEGSLQMSEICKKSQNGSRSGITDGWTQRGRSEAGDSGQSGEHGNGSGFEPAEAETRINGGARPKEASDQNSVLEISCL